MTALDQVREQIAAACRRSERAPGTVRLVAVSKTFPIAAIEQMMEQGQQLFGENRVQEALEKIENLVKRAPAIRFHFIGHLQRNKARHVVGRFELIHGVDDPRLVHELGKRAVAAGCEQSILLQVNLAGETTKSGVTSEQLSALLDSALQTAGVTPLGLMTIPPPISDPEENRRWFAELRTLRDQEAQRCGVALPELSMGMTSDFPVAIEEGATLIRVGRGVFGPRS